MADSSANRSANHPASHRIWATRRSRHLVLAVAAAALVLAACGGDGPAEDVDGHAAVSVPPSSTVTSQPQPGASPSGVATEVIDTAGFGMHVVQFDESKWPDIPIGSFRLWNGDTTWGALEKSPGSWTFEKLDLRIANAEARGAPVLLVLSHPPAWAATRPELKGYGGSPSPPKDDAAWRTYVRTVVERYAGRVEAYEVWNEPNLTQFFTGTPQELAALTASASEEIRAADPAALVVSAGFSARTAGSQPFFQAYVDAMDPATIDVLGIHIYPYPGDGPESMLTMVDEFRALAEAAGLGDKPMWNTEIGYGRTPTDIFSGDTAASLVLRTFLVLPAYGLQRNYWYMWDDRQFVGLYLVEADRATETPAAFALAEAERWLAGASISGCADLGDGLWECRLQREGVPITIVWKIGAVGSYTVPDGVTVQYLFTGDQTAAEAGATVEIGQLPVLYAPAPVPGLEAS